MSADTERVVMETWKAASSGDLAAVAESYTEDATYYGQGGQPVRGRENIAAVINTYLVAFPDMKLTVEDLFSAGDRVFSRVRAQGTNTGPLPEGSPATGRTVDIRWVMNVARIADGKIAEEWEIMDMMDMLSQLGVMEAAASAAAAAQRGS